MDTKKMGPRPALVRGSTRKSGARWSLPITFFLLFMAAQQGTTLEGSPGTGRIIIVGGVNDDWKPSSPYSEVLFGPALPPFPVAVYYNTLSLVRGSVYSCGGYNSSHAVIKKCWVIDTETEGAAWRSFDIPWAMARHSAVVVQDEIWFFDKNKLRILDTRTPANEPRAISQKFSFFGSICAVTYGSRTFVIGDGTGQRNNEVRVNNDPSKPEQWEIFSTSMWHRIGFACHEFGGDVFVTGGYSGDNTSNDLPFVEAISLADGTVRSFGPFGTLKRRRFHQMAIIDGRLAMLGGINKTHTTETIETYDKQTNTWKTLDRTLAVPRSSFGLTQFRP